MHVSPVSSSRPIISDIHAGVAAARAAAAAVALALALDAAELPPVPPPPPLAGGAIAGAPDDDGEAASPAAGASLSDYDFVNAAQNNSDRRPREIERERERTCSQQTRHQQQTIN